jgi:hypothetical protein
MAGDVMETIPKRMVDVLKLFEGTMIDTPRAKTTIFEKAPSEKVSKVRHFRKWDVKPPFVGIEYSLIDSELWKRLSHSAIALYIQVVRTWDKSKDVASPFYVPFSYKDVKGMMSKVSYIQKRKELLDCGLLVTVQQPGKNKKGIYALNRVWDEPDEDFYNSDAWRKARYQAFARNGNVCQCCGKAAGGGVVLHVDHIKPRSKYPELALDVDNLQILCRECNLGKSNFDDTDWRDCEKA